ncbi:MAG: twin-arginine translocation signal domain-containing protein, partial [Gemmatimonadota bacterium]
MKSNRRSFLARLAAAGTAVALGSRSRAAFSAESIPKPRAAFDLVIRGGTVFDGTGAAGIEADIAITGSRIVRIARNVADRGTEEIDARGLAVSPGFVDIHSHGDGSLDADPRAESLVRQGITSIVVGQDGSSHGVREQASTEPGAASLAEMFKAIDELRPAVNVASMIGLGSV